MGLRPFQPKAGPRPGTGEADLVIGKDEGWAIGTLVERQTRMVRLLHMPQRDSDTRHDTLKARMGRSARRAARSIT